MFTGQQCSELNAPGGLFAGYQWIWPKRLDRATNGAIGPASAGVSFNYPLPVIQSLAVGARKRPIRLASQALLLVSAIGASMACCRQSNGEELRRVSRSAPHRGPLTRCSRCSRPCPGSDGLRYLELALFRVQRPQPPSCNRRQADRTRGRRRQAPLLVRTGPLAVERRETAWCQPSPPIPLPGGGW